jgi:hypothetical protein
VLTLVYLHGELALAVADRDLGAAHDVAQLNVT